MDHSADIPVDRIGVILVHGIGEQRRFQHLDLQLRYIIGALQEDQNNTVTVEIAAPGASAFEAEQNTWSAGPEASVTVVVRCKGKSRETRLMVHEVWWADVNESYSLAKQFRFWLWGLSVWAHPGKYFSGLPTSGQVEPPLARSHEFYDRFRLFLTGTFFMLVGMSIGVLTFFANRLLNWQTPRLLRTLTNYISAVKLYNQRRRFGAGLLWSREDFLDSVGEPPRVSVRRRMIRAIADVACNCYDRWYILAHSQGSVVAFNGLMETAYAWPGYLDEVRWRRLKNAGLAGQGRKGMLVPPGKTMPERPVSLAEDEIAYRPRIFARFRGFLTYGSPLEKFAGIWPALVPIGRERTFKQDIPWINIYDPIDPVSGRLLAFDRPAACCPHPRNYGYAASWWLLLAHLKYLIRRAPNTDAVTATVHWLLTDSTALFGQRKPGWRSGAWFQWESTQRKCRTVIAWITWVIAAVLLAMASAIILPMLLEAAEAALDAIGKVIVSLAPWLPEAGGLIAPVFKPIAVLIDWLMRLGSSYWSRVFLLGCVAILTTFMVGTGAWVMGFFKLDADDPRRKNGLLASQQQLTETFELLSATPDVTL